MQIYPQSICSRGAVQSAAVFVAVILASAAYAAVPTASTSQLAATAETTEESSVQVDSRLHVAGNLRMGITNNALQGQPNLTRVPPADADSTYPPAHSLSRYFEFPAGSYHYHLYESGLWIGGVVNGDTLVSTSISAGSYETREFTSHDSIVVSSNLAHSEFYAPSAKSQQQFVCRYHDTTAVGRVDELDERPHYPLGLEVTQTSHAWLSEPYDDFVIVVYSVKNISENLIESLHFGVFADGDINSHRIGSEQGAGDDVSGYLRDHGIAYIIDTDGDPHSTDESDTSGVHNWDSTSVRSAFAIAPLAIDPEPCCTTFQWWANNLHSQHPWYTPKGDRNIFRTMMRHDASTDQVFVAVPGDSTPPSPGSDLDELADGADTRFTLSFGSFDLNPGDSIRFAMAYVAGDSIHLDPDNFATNFSAQEPQPFYDNLYFGDLIRNTEAARLIYNNGFDLIGGAPPRVGFEPLNDESVVVRWHVAPFDAVSAYRVFRRDDTETETWELLGETDSSELEWTDHYATPGIAFDYAVAAVGTNGVEGFKSRPAKFTFGLPQTVPSFEILENKMEITVDWSVLVRNSPFASPEYVNIYRRTATGPAEVIARLQVSGQARGTAKRSEPAVAAGTARRSETAIAAGIGSRRRYLPSVEINGEFIDPEVESGVEYWYSASVTNTLGVEGLRSEEERAIPMTLDRPGIVIVHRGSGGWAIHADSAMAFYFDWARAVSFDTTLLWNGFEHQYLETWGLENRPVSAVRLFSHYETVLFASDDISGGFGTEFLAGLEDHSTRGGRWILMGRYLPWRYDVAHHEYSGGNWFAEYSDESLARRVFGIKSAIWELPYVVDTTGGDNEVVAWSVEFVGADAADQSYPTLELDSAYATTLLSAWAGDRLPIYGGGVVPEVGALLEFENADVLYTYNAGFPDTSSLQGLPVAIRSTDPDKRFVLFNLPLSLMERDAAYIALNTALADLGGMSPAVVTTSRSITTQEILDYLYGASDQAANPAFDTNADGIIDLRDAVHRIDETQPDHSDP